MTVCAKDTGMGTWECPECGIPNDLFLEKGEPLPEELDCDFCDHESGPIKWES